MNTLQLAIAFTANGLVASAAVGCVLRRRYRIWWSFFLYLLTVFIVEMAILVAPAMFHTPEFWQAKEIVVAGLRFAVAVEVGIRTMRAFPGALAAARRIVLLVLAVTLAAVATAPAGKSYETFIGELQPRVLNGSIWMLMAIGTIILWYRLPVHPFHKAILLSYIPYIIVFTIVARVLAEQGVRPGGTMQYLNQLAYVALVAYWNRAIWRRDPPVGLRSPPGQGVAAGRSGAA